MFGAPEAVEAVVKEAVVSYYFPRQRELWCLQPKARLGGGGGGAGSGVGSGEEGGFWLRGQVEALCWVQVPGRGGGGGEPVDQAQMHLRPKSANLVFSAVPTPGHAATHKLHKLNSGS